jgi:hypothetical protein
MADRVAVREVAVKRRAYDRCVRCGGPTQWGRAVCRTCNPAGLPEPSPAQYHATVFIAIALVLATVVVAVLLLR